jgi:hypothetical protein
VAQDLENLLNRLVEENVDFVLVGGFAAVAHGGSMLTQDVDVCCRFSGENLSRLHRAIADLNPVHRMSPDRRSFMLGDRVETFKNLYLDTAAGQLDCMSEITGIGNFELVVQASVEIRLSAGSVRILSLEGLIGSKRLCNSGPLALWIADL